MSYVVSNAKRHLPGSAGKTACGLDMTAEWARYERWCRKFNVTELCGNCSMRQRLQIAQKKREAGRAAVEAEA